METQRHLGMRVRILSQTIHTAIDRKLTALGLTGQQSFVLRFLSEHTGEPVYARDIEKRFNLTHPTVSGILQRLETKGFLMSETESSDRRCKRVTMTPKAEECQKEIERHIQALERTMVAGMTPEEAISFVRLLDLAYENLSNEMKKEEFSV